MHDFVQKEIKRIYSSYDGWKITPRKKSGGYDTIFLIERMNKGHREIVKVLATFKKEVTLDMVSDLIQPEPVYDGTVPRYDYAVMAPGNADISSLPSDLKTFTMKTFTFEGKELTWVKKPIRVHTTTEV